MRDSVRVNRHPANAKFLRQIALFSDRAEETRGDKRQATQKKRTTRAQTNKRKRKTAFQTFHMPLEYRPPHARFNGNDEAFFSETSLCWHNFCLNLRLFFRADAPVVRCKKHILAAISAVCYSM